MNRYTTSQIEFLRKGYQAMNVRDLTVAFNKKYGTEKTETAIKSALANRRIGCGRKQSERLYTPYSVYDDEMVEYVLSVCQGRLAKEVAELFNERFGTDKTEQQIRAMMKNRGINSGVDCRFEKGHKPWNTGTRGLTGPNSGSFKKGSIPPNLKPIGHERVCTKNGYILMKVAEKNPYTGSDTRYKAKHVHIWEQNNGPVPKGMVIFFIDGNPLNNEVDNLMLVCRLELLLLNQLGYRDAPAETKPSILAMVRLKAKVIKLEKK